MKPIKVLPQAKISLLLRIQNSMDLLLKTSEELQQELEKKPELKPALRAKPRWFYRDFQEPQPRYVESEIKKVEDQLRYEFDGLDLDIAREIIANLNHKGFFVGSVEEIAEHYGVSPEYVEDIREFIVRELEPTGVACKSLEEFLLVQLEELYPEDRELPKKLSDFLAGKGADRKVKEVLSALKLSPFEGSDVVYKGGSVELSIEYDGREWYLFVLDDFWDLDHMDKSFAFLLELRRKVLRSIGELIIEKQKEFLLGRGPLKALKLKEVAERVQVSLSTVSRVVSNKYARTPAGVYSLKTFFVRESKGGYSKEEVLKALKEILNCEGESLTDAEIAKRLEKKGIKLARRTVNKYRRLLKEAR